MITTQPNYIPRSIYHSITNLDQSVFDSIRNGQITLINQADRLAYEQKMQFSIYNSRGSEIVILDFLIDEQGYVYADYYDYIVKYTNSNIDLKGAIMRLFNTDEPRIVITSDDGLSINDTSLYDGYIANNKPIRNYNLIQGDIYLH